jgi:hypothetical protein
MKEKERGQEEVVTPHVRSRSIRRALRVGSAVVLLAAPGRALAADGAPTDVPPAARDDGADGVDGWYLPFGVDPRLGPLPFDGGLALDVGGGRAVAGGVVRGFLTLGVVTGYIRAGAFAGARAHTRASKAVAIEDILIERG